jgi:GNAT superfamily N-acetyltransferase
MDKFLRESAHDQHRKFRNRVYLATLDGKTIGYYTLSAASREPEKISPEAEKLFARIKSAPCIYLGMFAVDSKFQRNGVGRKMMVHAMETTLSAAEIVGVYALILDGADAEVSERYKKWGFEYFIEGKAEFKMYIPIVTMQSATVQTGQAKNRVARRARS